MLDAVKEYRINITAVSPGVFCDTTPLSLEEKKESEKVLPRTFKLAHKLDTDKVIIFGFKKPQNTKERNYPSEAVEALRHVAERAEKEGLTLALENEPICWADTGENTARIVKAVGNKALRVNWDPANALNAGDTPFPLGYGYVKNYIANVHVKDVRLDPSTGKWRYVEGGGGCELERSA